MGSRITSEHLDHWLTHGYVIVEEFLSRSELEDAREGIKYYMPAWEEYSRAPARYQSLLQPAGLAYVWFPFAGDTLNNICTHPELIALAEKITGTNEIALSHSQIVGKYAGARDYDQSLHCDYRNNTLAYPKDDPSIFDIPMILYYSEVTEDLGPTYVVSQKHAPLPPDPPVLEREDFAEAYEREVPVVVPAGSILIYSMRTYHRGSAMRATEGCRFSHHMGLRTAAHRWLGQSAFQNKGGSPEMNQFLERATPRQRELVGFPPPGHTYWDEETLAGVARRYPDMDMSPYTSFLSK
jgi:ectoine hydroxylase-related dioxygenase (phytanoyl-CoA dioxygenase family)